MIKGLEFKVKNGYGHVLYNLLQKTNIDTYDWYAYESEIIMDNNSFRIDSGLLHHEKTKQLFDISSDYYLMFIILQAYQKGSSTQVIKTYEEFMCSDCDFIILISDGTLVEIYTKTDKDFLRFANIASDIAHGDICIKTKNSDGRTSFEF